MAGDLPTPILLDDAALDELMKFPESQFPDVPLPAENASSLSTALTTPSLLHAMGTLNFDIPLNSFQAIQGLNCTTNNTKKDVKDNNNNIDNKSKNEEPAKVDDDEKNENGASAEPQSAVSERTDSKTADSKKADAAKGTESGNTDPAAQSFQAFAEQNQRLQHENHRYSILVSQLTAEVSQLRFQVQAQDLTIGQLRTKMTEQRSEFDSKFDQFLVCANQYDQTKAKEIENLKMQIMMMNTKYKDLSLEYGKLTARWMSKPQCNAGQWKNWKWLDIFEWMSSLNEPRLKKYDQALYDNLQRDNASGQWLEMVQEDDLYYLGIKNYTDRQVLMHHIKMLLHGLTHEPPPTSLKSTHSNNSLLEVGSKTFSTPNSNSSVGGLDGYNMSPSCSYLSGRDDRDCTHPDHSYYKQFSVEQLQQIRIRQKNIVYVVGLPVSLCNAKLLKSHKWFGKFGTISRICFNTSPKCVKANSIPTFVTYTNESDALQAIRKMNLFCLADGTRLKTNFGRTKFCPAFTQGDQCMNEKCKFLHHWAKVDDIITEQEISDFNAIRAGPPSRFSRR